MLDGDGISSYLVLFGMWACTGVLPIMLSSHGQNLPHKCSLQLPWMIVFVYVMIEPNLSVSSTETKSSLN
jgi:hypothetical protein